MSLEDLNGAAPAAADAPAFVESAPAPVDNSPPPAATEQPARSIEDTAGEVWDRLHAPRDETGKFASKAPEKVEPDAKPSDASTDTPASPAPAGEAPKPPVSWPQDKAEAWSKLDPDARDYILKREAEVAKGFQTTAEKYKPLEEVDRLLEPYKAKLEAEGLSPVQGIQRLLRAQDIMERNPIEGLNWLARSYGVNLGQLAAQPAGQEQTQQPPIDPRVETLQQRLDRIEADAASRAKLEAETFEQSLKQEVEKYRTSPEHPYFDEVRPQMAALLNAGEADDVPDAYKKAVWLNEAVRARVLEDQRKAEATKAAEAAAKAKAAGSLNVRSSPANSAPPKSIDETLSRAWDAAHAR